MVILYGGLGLLALGLITLTLTVAGALFGPTREGWVGRIRAYDIPRAARTGRSSSGGVPVGDLDRAGIPLDPRQWRAVRLAAMALASVVLVLLSGVPLLGVAFGVVAGWAATRAYVTFALRRRLNMFAEQLPDALQTLSGSLRSGFTVSQALQRLSETDIEPLGAEMRRAIAATRVGMPVEEALEQVAVRMECADLSWVVLAIHIQRDVGGNLAEILEGTVETMRERARLRRQVRTLSAEGRLTTYIMIALPVALGVFLALVRTAYVRPMFTQPLGLVLVGAAVTAIAAGWFWMQTIVKLKV